jgi:hypothetical protein
VGWFTNAASSPNYDIRSNQNGFQLHQRVMREKILKTTFFSTALIATGGWVWLLYAGLRWVTNI